MNQYQKRLEDIKRKRGLRMKTPIVFAVVAEAVNAS